jgi:hypothetical protein
VLKIISSHWKFLKIWIQSKSSRLMWNRTRPILYLLANNTLHSLVIKRMLNQNTSFSKLTFSISKKRKICIGTLLGCQRVSLKCTRPQIIYQKKVFFPMRTTVHFNPPLIKWNYSILKAEEQGLKDCKTNRKQEVWAVRPVKEESVILLLNAHPW